MMILIKWFPLLVLLLSLVVDVFVNAFAFQHSTPAGYGGALIRGKRPLSASFIEAENEMSETKPAINQPATASAKVFLKELLSFTGSSEQKKELLQKAREAGSSKSRWSMEPSFDTLLAEVYNEENNKPIFNFRYPIPVPSYRVKLARLRRVMDAYMEDDDTGSDAETKKARALVGALAQAAGARGGVWGLEREALASAGGRALTMADMLKRTPDLETPSYTVLLANPRQQWELREYAAFSVVSLAMPGGGEGGGGGGGGDRPGVQTTAPAAASAFNQLAGYIFGKNQEGEKMAMTTPVISSVLNDDEEAAREMSFVMPSKFWAPEALGAAPTPLAPEGGGPGVAVRPARMGGGGGGAGAAGASIRDAFVLQTTGVRELDAGRARALLGLAPRPPAETVADFLACEALAAADPAASSPAPPPATGAGAL
mmetsp:Transcript_31402/g.54434  ORF Transcript_31402/g.54434 Transcript_31402/m.54434 type:complete len:429 (-) Transcript_31402:409-1695(-)